MYKLKYFLENRTFFFFFFFFLEVVENKIYQFILLIWFSSLEPREITEILLLYCSRLFIQPNKVYSEKSIFKHVYIV